MLTIRREQMIVFKNQAEERFIDKMVLYLRKQFSEETAAYSDKALRARIRIELTSAKRFQLISERSICYFLNLSIMYGEGFMDREDALWMRDYLTDPDAPDPNERMYRLYQAVIKRLEVEADNQRIMAEFNESTELGA